MSEPCSGTAQSVAILRTKLYIPPPRPGAVPRMRLIEQLETGMGQGPAGFARKLTLISAPAGSGKTTLLSAWAARGDWPVAWLTLDSDDNDPVRFLTYLIAALQTVEPELGGGVLSTLQAPGITRVGGSTAGEVLLIALLNDISARSAPFVLILDDYHLIESEAVHHALTFLLDYLPPVMHLVIGTRLDPPLSLPRLRGRSELNEIRIHDLRFSIEEAAEFLNACLDLDLLPQDIATLEARTEGWIVGLQMAGLSMKGQSPADRRDFVTAFAGDDRYVVDYLMDEVLHSQSESLQTFLLETAVLDRLCGPLCDALRFATVQGPDLSVGAVVSLRAVPSERVASTEDGTIRKAEGSQAILEKLEEANLFLIPLDAKRHWYRYHRLFSDLLRFRLQQAHPEWMQALHARASCWYEQNGFVAEAVAHARSADDLDRVASLLELSSWMLLSRGETSTVLGWLDALPRELVRERPRLGLAYAWTSMAAMHLDAIEPRLRDVERQLSGSPNETTPGGRHDDKAQQILGEVAAIRATVASMRGDAPAAIQLSHEALARLPADDARLRGIITNTLGTEYEQRGDVAAACQAFSQSAALSQAVGSTLVALIALGNLARMQQVQGRLREAAGTCRRALGLAAEWGVASTAAAGMAHAGLGTLHYEWNELDAASERLTRAIELGKKAGIMELAVGSSITLSRLHQAQGDLVAALDRIDAAEQLVQDFDVTAAIAAQVRACRASLLTAAGDLETAAHLLRDAGLYPGDEDSNVGHAEYVAVAQIVLAQGMRNGTPTLEEANRLLSRLASEAEAQGRMGHAIQLFSLQALVLQELGAAAEAGSVLARALALGEPEGYMRTFVDAGPSMRDLLRQALRLGVAPEYVRRLLATFVHQRDEPAVEKAMMSSDSAQAPLALVDPLSERELEVLRLVADGLSNREIAEQLVITVGTVKWHINNIYGKMDVRRRTEAVALAREMGLL